MSSSVYDFMQKGLSVFRRDVLRTNYPFCHTRLSKGKDASLIKFFPASSVPLLSKLAFLCECVAEKPKDHWYLWAIFFNLCKKTLCFTPRCFCTVSEDTFPESEASQHLAFSTALARALMTHSLVLMPEEQAKLHVLPCLSLCKAEVQFHR